MLGAYVVLAFALYYAIQGGEYSSVDLVRQRSREKMLKKSIDSLRHAVDSLTDFKKRVQGDLALQLRHVRSDPPILFRVVLPKVMVRIDAHDNGSSVRAAHFQTSHPLGLSELRPKETVKTHEGEAQRRHDESNR